MNMLDMPRNSIIALILVFASFGFAQSLGSHSAAEINFSDTIITEAEVDVVQQTFAKPGIAPDNPFYFLKRFGEFLRFNFAFSREEKARLRLAFAKERLAEANYLLKRNKSAEAVNYINEYSEEINKTQGIGANVSQIARETEDTLLKSVLVLELVREKAPEQAQPAIDRAINKSLERKAHVKAEIKIEEAEEEAERTEIKIPEGDALIGVTIPPPPSKEQLIEEEAGKELEKEIERHAERAMSIEAVKEKVEAIKEGTGAVGIEAGLKISEELIP